MKKKAKTKNENIIFSKREELFFLLTKRFSSRYRRRKQFLFFRRKGCSKEHIFLIFRFGWKKIQKNKRRQTKTDYVKWELIEEEGEIWNYVWIFCEAHKKKKNKEEIQKTKLQKDASGKIFKKKLPNKKTVKRYFHSCTKLTHSSKKHKKKRETERRKDTFFEKKSPTKEMRSKTMREIKKKFRFKSRFA